MNEKVIKEFIAKYGDLRKWDGEKYNGYLDLRGTGITELPEGLAVAGYLDLRGTGITELPEGLQVGGSLDLRGTGITELPEGLAVAGDLDLSGTGITELPEGLAVAGYLDLRGTGITELPEGLQVGGSLDLRGTGITELPEGLQVGGYLDLPNGGSRYIGAKVKKPIIPKPECAYIMRWKWRDREYIKVDGIFTRIVAQKGNVMRVQRIAHKEVEYLITDGAGKWAHGSTLKEARESLDYKISDRDTSRYDGLTLDSVLTHAEAIECYRVITGACYRGTRYFVENILPADKLADSYTIREIIELTKGQYQSQAFADFFKR